MHRYTVVTRTPSAEKIFMLNGNKTRMQRKWGIYNGFVPANHPLNKWKEPACPACHRDLSPWIDWWSSGSIGFCKPCSKIFIVNSEWIPSPETNLRLEIYELVGHSIKELDSVELTVDMKELITLHENIPLNQAQVHRLCTLKVGLQRKDTPESCLIQHLIWSLILNSDWMTASMVKDYIEFVYLHPHYYHIYDQYEIWIGHEIDIAQRLENKFKTDLTRVIYEIWKRDHAHYPVHHFKSRIGFYVSLDDSDLIEYGKEFFDFAKKIKKRITFPTSAHEQH